MSTDSPNGEETGAKRPSRRFRDERIRTSVLVGHSIAETARECGVSESTVRRRLADEDFRSQLADTQAETVRQATVLLESALLEAGKTLLDLADEKYPPAIRHKAANSIFDHWSTMRTFSDLHDRLRGVEAAVDVRAAQFRRAS